MRATGSRTGKTQDMSHDEMSGPPNAENRGVWRILRNSLALTVTALAAILVIALYAW